MKLTRYKLGELIDVRRGASLSGEYYATEGDLIRLTLGNFDYQGGGFKDNTSKNDLYFVGPVKQEFILSEGDIITPLTEQTPGLLGSTAQIPVSQKYIQSQDVALLIPDESKLNKDFCYYLLPSKIVKQQLAAGAQQTKIRHTTPDRIKDLTVFIPVLEDQRGIGKLLKSIDRKIALNREINRNLEAMLDTITDYYLSSSSILKECIRNLGTIKAGGDCPTIFKNEVSEEFKIPIYSNGINNEGLYGYTTNESKIVPARTLTIAARGTIGASFIRMTPYVPIIRLISIIPYDKGGDIWIHQMVNRMTFEKNGSVQQQLTVPEISNFNIPYPSSTEILKYESQTTPILQIIHSNKTEINKLQHLRETLLPLLMNGQVSVMPQEVNCDLSHD